MKTPKDLKRFVKQKTAGAVKNTRSLIVGKKGEATPVFVLGVQRSGTTMMMHCFDKLPDFEVLGEESRATVNIRLKSESEIKQIIADCRFKFIAFKPLMESAQADYLLNFKKGAKAIWMFRRVEDRASSAVERFGDHNLEVLSAIAEGKMLDSWQAQGLGESDFELIKSFDWKNVSPKNAAAIFWYLRNSLFFSQKLNERDDVIPVCYEDLVSNPVETLQRVCDFIGCDFDTAMADIVHGKSVGKGGNSLDPEIANLCGPMYDRLKAAQESFLARTSS